MSLKRSAVRRAAEGPSFTTGSRFKAAALAQRLPRSETLGLNRIGAALADLDRAQRLGGAIEPCLVLAVSIGFGTGPRIGFQSGPLWAVITPAELVRVARPG